MPFDVFLKNSALFLLIKAVIYSIVMILLFTSGHWWNWFLDVNTYAHQLLKAEEIPQSYFWSYHGTSRTMYPLEEKQMNSLIRSYTDAVWSIPVSID